MNVVPWRSRVFALVFAVLAFMAIGIEHLVAQESEVAEYDLKFQNVSADLKLLTQKLARFPNVQPTEEDRKKLLELRKDQKRFLDKLLLLDPDNDAYRFELAKLFHAEGDRARALSILLELAPMDVAGHPEAHYVLAQHYFELGGLDDAALTHVDHALSRDKGNFRCRNLKAKILVKLERYEDAYLLYEKLLELDPKYFREMVQLNRLLKREDENQPLYEKALARYQQLSEREEYQNDDRRWIIIEAGIVNTRQNLEQFAEAEERLVSLIDVYKADSTGGPRRLYLERLLADTYVKWARDIANPKVSYNSVAPETQAKVLDLYTKAFRAQRDNVHAMESLSRLSFSSNAEISEQAKSVYDPVEDVDAPMAVLNQLGNHALLKRKFPDAIRYYERAVEKSRDLAVLNNLAYAYLVATDEGRNPERALQLIEEAIGKVPAGMSGVEFAKFQHTKATALKQLDRTQEAIDVFEESLKARPGHADTLRSLLQCYKKLGKVPPEQYAETLEEQKK